MSIKLEVANKTKRKIKKNLLEKIVRETIKLCGVGKSEMRVSLVFIGQKEIQKLNRKYRRKNEVTDILSFLYTSGYNKEKGNRAASVVEGELVLCPVEIEISSKRNKLSFNQELAFVLSHGILHLLGIRHGRKMYQLQDRVAAALKK